MEPAESQVIIYTVKELYIVNTGTQGSMEFFEIANIQARWFCRPNEAVAFKPGDHVKVIIIKEPDNAHPS